MTVELGVRLFQVAFWVYLAATACYVGQLFRTPKYLSRVGTGFLAAGLMIHIASLVVRTVAAQRPPFLNLYEYLLSLTCGAVIVYLVLEMVTKNRVFGAFVSPLIVCLAFLTMRLPTEVNPTMPALRSAWRVPHIATAVLAYASFGIAFGLAVMYLLRERAGNSRSFWAMRLPAAKILDVTTYRTIAFGFLMQTLLLITGAIWAEKAWGSYWSWDPKETWALITWLIYAAYLHMRMNRGWQGRRSAVIAIVGFAATMFTLLGVSLLMGGMHSYAG